MQTQKCSSLQQSKHQILLKCTMDKYDQLDCKLNERLSVTQLQCQTLKKIQYIIGKEDGFMGSVVGKMRGQIQEVRGCWREWRKRGTEQLLRKQTKLEQQAQCRDIIKQYESRILQMDFTVYSKEVDISVDHVGKLSEEKPSSNKVREYNSIKIENANIWGFMQKIGQFRDELATTNSKIQHKPQQSIQPQQQIPETHPDHQFCSQTKTQSAITKQSQSSSSSTSSNPEIESSPAPNKIGNKNRKMLIIGTQQHMYDKFTLFSDPQMVKIATLLKNQQKREEKLKREYERFMGQYQQICRENKQLSKEYGRNVSYSKPKRQEVQICIPQE